MSPPKQSEPEETKKMKPHEALPRPGTMAHLRYVEAQKRREMEEQQGDETSLSRVVDHPPKPKPHPSRAFLQKGRPRQEPLVKAHMLIHGAATATAVVAGGLAQIPFSGSVIITPIQISMIIALGSLHGKALGRSSALGVLGAAYGPYVGRSVSQFLIGRIPGFGNAINAATAFVVTESIGWAADRILSSD